MIVFAGLLMTIGCGGPAKSNYQTAKLAGTVRVDGVTVEQGRIRFSPTKPDQAPAAEGPITAGQYTIDKAPVGDVTVTFTGAKKTGHTIELYGQNSEESISVIPTKYSRGLPATVDADGHRNFDLTSQ